MWQLGIGGAEGTGGGICSRSGVGARGQGCGRYRLEAKRENLPSAPVGVVHSEAGT